MANLLIHKDLIEKLVNGHFHGLIVKKCSDMGDDLFLCSVESPQLKDGFHGQCDFIIVGEHGYILRRTIDV